MASGPCRHAAEHRVRNRTTGPFFSGSAWEFDPIGGEYHLHLFSRKQST